MIRAAFGVHGFNLKACILNFIHSHHGCDTGIAATEVYKYDFGLVTDLLKHFGKILRTLLNKTVGVGNKYNPESVSSGDKKITKTQPCQ